MGSGGIDPHILNLCDCLGPRIGMDNMGGEKSWPHRDLNCNPLAIQPIVSHYGNCTIPARRQRGIDIKVGNEMQTNERQEVISSA
jgi:hypothetical protein